MVVVVDGLFNEMGFVLEVCGHGGFVVHTNATGEVWACEMCVDFDRCVGFFVEQIIPKGFGFFGGFVAFNEVVDAKFGDFTYCVCNAVSYGEAVGVGDGHETKLNVVEQMLGVCCGKGEPVSDICD